MMDFLKAFPCVSKEEYLWEWSSTQTRLAMYDNSHIVYLSEKQSEIQKAKNNDTNRALTNDLGIPIFSSENIEDNNNINTI